MNLSRRHRDKYGGSAEGRRRGIRRGRGKASDQMEIRGEIKESTREREGEVEGGGRGSEGRTGRRRARNGRASTIISGWYILALTVGPLDVNAAADVDVARTVIHGHLVAPAHLVRHHKTRPASSVNYPRPTGTPHAAD